MNQSVHLSMISSMLVSILLVIVLSGLVGCQSVQDRPSSVVVISTETGYQLLRHGKPYTILGVGGTEHLPELAQAGGNTIRTWDAEGIEPLLDEAHELGLAVVVGIWLEHQRHGHDPTDPVVRTQQLERVERFVLQFRDHPALLAWGVGNEVELGGDLDVALGQIREASEVIKSLDPNHPTMAVIAEIGKDKAKRIQDECPDIDIVGVNAYGGMGSVAARLAHQGYTGPFVITEFGPVGFWETGRSPWGAPYEQTSSGKAAFMADNYQKTVVNNLGKQCLGSFAFLWGAKQETTATWFGLFLESGESTESVDVLTEFWSGKQPANRAPSVTALEIDRDAGTLSPASTLSVFVVASDPDGDTLHTEWRVVPESTVQSEGGDFEEQIDAVQAEIVVLSPTSASITLPAQAGAYRVFAVVRDGQGHAGTANLPILVVEP